MSEHRGIDCHVHTARCGHAVGTPAEYVAAAADSGLDVIAITDHLPFPGGHEPGYCMADDELPAYVAEVDALRAAPPDGLKVLLGVEADWCCGVGDRLEALAGADLDVVLGSVHMLDGWAFDDPDLVARYERTDVDALWARYFEVYADAAASGLFDVMAHPDLVKKFGYLPSRDPQPLYRRVADALASSGVAIEVNTAGWRKPCAEAYPSLALLREFQLAGVPATVGSDAHAPAEVGYRWKDAADLLREAGYDRVVYFQGRRPIERRL